MHPVTYLALCMVALAAGLAIGHIAVDIAPAQEIPRGGLIYDDGRWQLLHDGEWRVIKGVVI